MKKLLLLLLLAVTLFSSCKKEAKQKCYHCTFSPFMGQNPEPIDYCGDDEGMRRFTDAAGNELGGRCVEK